MEQPRNEVARAESAGGVATPPDDGGHMGSHTVPADLMDQTVGSEALVGTQGKRARVEPRSGFPVIGLLVVVLVLAGMALLTLTVGL